MIYDLSMRGRILQILAVDLRPLLQRLSVSDSSAHVSPYQPRESECVRPSVMLQCPWLPGQFIRTKHYL
jgi:hypothetical protein